jgi:Icc-related predicted phosphoesterase
MKIVAISDTHCQLHKISLPEGEILVHAGDLTYRGTLNEMAQQFYDLGQHGKKFKHTIAICGNHDWLGEKEPNTVKMLAKENGVIWLQDDMVEIEGIKFYGSAWTPEFCNWAFNLDRNDGSLEEAWDKIPEGIDILMTHGPAYGRQDHSYDGPLGCTKLMRAIDRVKPKAHIFGHIHHSYGYHIGADGILYANASTCNESYDPINKPIVFDYTDGKVEIEWPIKETSQD